MNESLEQVREATSAPAWRSLRLSVSAEAALYIGLASLALILRLSQLGSAPLNNAEAHEALAAWRFAQPAAPGAAPLASNPILFALNSLIFAAFGASEWTARLLTAIAGTALVLTPILWRRELGRSAALMASLLLAVSPVTFADARMMSPAIWSMMLAIIGLRLTWHFVQTRQEWAALAAGPAWLGVILMADPAGWVLVAILLFAWWFAARRHEDDPPEQHPVTLTRAALGQWPWLRSLLYGGLAVLLIATLFFVFPRGLSQVGEVIGRGLSGVLTRPAGGRFAFPLLTSFLYEPVLWFLGIVGVYGAARERNYPDSYLIGWLIGAVIAALVYAGAGAQYALWITIPLAVLGGKALARLVGPVRDAYWTVPRWAVPMVMMGTLALLWIAATNFIRVARSLLGYTPGLSALPQPLHLLLAGMAFLLLVILFFLSGSLWGSRAAWKGVALGLVLFLGTYGLSAGWRVAVTHIDSPYEFWHVQPVSRTLTLLRETMIDSSLRYTGRPDAIAIVAQTPDDQAVAWQLRDYANLRFVNAINQRENAPVIVAPDSFQPTSLGARYVGQDFILTRDWDFNTLRLEDVPAWIMYRVAQSRPFVSERVVVWLRDDVYGLPPLPDLPGEEIAP